MPTTVAQHYEEVSSFLSAMERIGETLLFTELLAEKIFRLHLRYNSPDKKPNIADLLAELKTISVMLLDVEIPMMCQEKLRQLFVDTRLLRDTLGINISCFEMMVQRIAAVTQIVYLCDQIRLISEHAPAEMNKVLQTVLGIELGASIVKQPPITDSDAGIARM